VKTLSKTEKAIKRLESCSIIPFDEDSQEVCGLAIQALREKQERSAAENKPLSLEELRQMDGEPVWTVTIGLVGSGRWELMNFTTLSVYPYHPVITLINLIDGQEDYELDTYGKTWLAYAHKSEQEEKQNG
jgi:hypothetical protein